MSCRPVEPSSPRPDDSRPGFALGDVLGRLRTTPVDRLRQAAASTRSQFPLPGPGGPARPAQSSATSAADPGGAGENRNPAPGRSSHGPPCLGDALINPPQRRDPLRADLGFRTPAGCQSLGETVLLPGRERSSRSRALVGRSSRCSAAVCGERETLLAAPRPSDDSGFEFGSAVGVAELECSPHRANHRTEPRASWTGPGQTARSA